MKRLDRDTLAEYQKNSRKSPTLYKNYLNPNQGYATANFTPLREEAEYGGFAEGLPIGQQEAEQAVVDKWRDTLPQDMQGKSLSELVDLVRGNANMYADYNNPTNMASLRQSIENNFNQRNQAAAQKYNQPVQSSVPQPATPIFSYSLGRQVREAQEAARQARQQENARTNAMFMGRANVPQASQPVQSSAPSTVNSQAARHARDRNAAWGLFDLSRKLPSRQAPLPNWLGADSHIATGGHAANMAQLMGQPSYHSVTREMFDQQWKPNNWDWSAGQALYKYFG